MKAIVPNEFGAEYSVQIVDVEKPTPKNQEILIEVEAAAMNPAELMILESGPADCFNEV